MIQASNQMAVLVETTRSQFGEELNRKLASVSVQAKTMLVELQRWRDTADSLNDKMVSLVDLVALDLEDIVPFSDKLAVRRIRGGVFIEKDPSTYIIDLTGPHFGGDPAGTTTKFEVSLNGVKLGNPDLKPPINAVFSVKEDVVKGLFKDDQMVVLPLMIHVKRSSGRIWPTTQEISLPYKVSLLPRYAGKVTVTSQYPEFAWQPGDTIRPISVTIREDQAKVGFPFTSSIAGPALGGAPKPGNQKIDRQSLEVTCKPDMQPGRQFENGKLYPLNCLRGTPEKNVNIFEKGFMSSSWVGGGGDQYASYGYINNEFFARFGFRVNRRQLPGIFGLQPQAMGPPPNLEDRCAESEHCILSPQELAAHSQPVSMDVSSCPFMEWKRNETSWDLQDTKVTAFIRTKLGVVPDDLCLRGGNATWEMSYNVLQYGPKADLAKKTATYQVYAGKPVEIPVKKSEGNGAVHSTITFDAVIGPGVTTTIPSDLSPNFRSTPPTELDDRVMYSYTFQYPKLP